MYTLNVKIAEASHCEECDGIGFKPAPIPGRFLTLCKPCNGTGQDLQKDSRQDRVTPVSSLPSFPDDLCLTL